MIDCDAVQEFLNSERGVESVAVVMDLVGSAKTPADVLWRLQECSDDALKDIILQLLVVVDDLQDRIGDLEDLCDAEANSF